MSKDGKLIKSFGLAGTKEGVISVIHLNEPYGKGSSPVTSIGISLKGNTEEADWKAHIPYENLDDLIAALEKKKKQQA